MSKRHRRNRNPVMINLALKIAITVNIIGILTVIFILASDKNPRLIADISSYIDNIIK